MSTNDLIVKAINLLEQIKQPMTIYNLGKKGKMIEAFVPVGEDRKTLDFFKQFTAVKHLHHRYNGRYFVYAVIDDSICVSSIVCDLDVWLSAFPDSVEGDPT